MTTPGGIVRGPNHAIKQGNRTGYVNRSERILLQALTGPFASGPGEQVRARGGPAIHDFTSLAQPVATRRAAYRASRTRNRPCSRRSLMSPVSRHTASLANRSSSTSGGHGSSVTGSI
jgi:hypothetical protein